jgi:purine nucleoside phosphorylase
VLGIIGGSGIYDLPGLEKVRQRRIRVHGEPSAPLRRRIAGLPVVFLSRHDKGHRLSPSDINYRANIDVLKRAGVTDLVSLSACGSFKQELPPGTFVLVDQFVDAPTIVRARSSARAASRTSRWRIRSRRACRTASPPRPGSKASRSCAAAPTSAWKARNSRATPSMTYQGSVIP